MRYSVLLSLGVMLAAGSSVIVAQTPSASGQAGAVATRGQAMLNPGDSVRITVWRNPEYNGEFVVAPDGSISHPLFRNVKVAHMPLDQAEANLRKYLAPLVTGSDLIMEPMLRVAVLGDALRPQVFAVQPETSIAEAIARAGGINPNGDGKHIRVVRTDQSGAQRVFFVNFEDSNDPLVRTAVQSSDQIFVNRRKSFFRDLFMPAIGVIGSVASLGLLIDRVSRR